MIDHDKRRARLEVDITLAMVAVRAARHAEDRSPNPTNKRRTEEAQADLDDLLDMYRKLFGADVLAY